MDSWVFAVLVSDASKLRISCPEELKHYAVRVEEHVPIFESKVRFSRGLAATLSGGPPAHSSGGPFVVGVAAGSSESSAAPAPPGDLESVAPACEDQLVPEGEVPRVSARVQALRDEAVSKEHQLFRFLKNPFCDTCNRPDYLPGAFVAKHGRIMSLMNTVQSVFLERSLLQIRSMCTVLLIRPALRPVSMWCFAFGIISLVCLLRILALIVLRNRLWLPCASSLAER